MTIAKELQRLSSERYGWLRRLSDRHLFDLVRLDDAINELVHDRFQLAKAFLDSAGSTTIYTDVDARNTVSRCYYAIYQASRALVLHVIRSDLDDHIKLSRQVRDILGVDEERLVTKWRDARNEMDYSPYPDLDDTELKGLSLPDVASRSLVEARDFLNVVHGHLVQRGVTL